MANNVSEEFIEKMQVERAYQRERWTEPHDDRHNALEWSGLLARYVGRICDAALTDNRSLYRKALVVVAAVAMAAFEADYRKSEPWLRDDPGATLPDAAP